jgi:hypothetical protein
MQNKLKLLLVAVLAAQASLAQNAGTVRGTVTDPSAASVPGAAVQIVGNGITRNAKADAQGKFTLTLPPGSYNVRADAKGFTTFTQQGFNVSAGQVSPLDIALQIAAEAQEVQVSDQAAGQVSVDPSSNVGAIVLKNEDLDALPDDPDDLQADLEALAGPAAGPNGAQFFVDGFSGGQLPPKSSIREIRINSNPFSAEFDQPGFGRIEILTKPGTDAFHGSILATYGDRVLDTRNPFLTGAVPGYNSKMFSGNVSGPITKKSSFFIDINRRDINQDNLIKAQTLNNNFNEVPDIGAYPTPNRLWLLSGRIDYALSPTNTLVMRYAYSDNTQTGGVGGFALPTQLTRSAGKNDNVQITETSILGTKAVDETRFQFRDNHTGTNAVASPGPGINVSGAFNSGGPPFTQPDYNFDKAYELQNILTFTQGTHAIKVGGRARQEDLTTFSTNNFNGSYNFSLPSGVVPSCLASYAVNGYTPTSLDLYQQTEIELSQGIPIATIIANGCGPTQFTLSQGTPLIHVRQFDLGMFVQDDWRLKPNLTVSTGIRYETQNNIHDHDDWAPRIGVAWAPWAKKNAPSKTVIRGGFGFFYSRVAIGDSEAALQNNGYTQQSYQLNSTSVPLIYYPNLPPPAALASGTLLQQNIDIIDHTARAPYLMQSAITLERSLPGRTTVSMNLVDSRGVHTLRQRDINAPLPGTYTGLTYGATGTGVLPFPEYGPLYQYETSGLYKQLQYVTNVSTRFGRRYSLNGYYALGFAHSNAQGLPMDQYNDNLDWGRAQFDVRHRGYFGGTIQLPWGVQAAPFVTMQSGSPFNITTGGTFDGDGIPNLRPTFALSSTPAANVKTTKYGTFDIDPAPGETFIPVNYGDGPAQFSANVRISRTWGWGEKVAPNPNAGAGGPDGGPDGGGRGLAGPGGGGRGGPGGGGGGGFGGGGGGGGGRGGGGGGFGGGGGRGGGRGGAASGKKYSLTATINARNFINHVNLGAPTGLITSPFFGESTSIAGGGGGGGFGGGGSAAGVRRIEFQLRLGF